MTELNRMTNRIEGFYAWCQSPDALEPISRPLPIGNPTDLNEALQFALAHCSRGQKLTICVRNALTGKATLYIYAISEGAKPRWQAGSPPNRPGASQAKLIHSVQVYDYRPVEPWRCKPGADRVFGNDAALRGVIEGRVTAKDASNAS